MPVHKCEFCHTEFIPRPQVKKPRACNHSACQKRRQRANEREWKQRFSLYLDAEYHRSQRLERRKLLKSVVLGLLRCLSTGKELLDFSFRVDLLSPVIEKFIFDLGMRQVNKFWSDFYKNNFKSLASGETA